MTTRTEPTWRPAATRAQRAVDEARRRWDQADTRARHLRRNKELAGLKALEIRRMGLEPHYYDGTEDEVWLAEQSRRVIMVWASDADIDSAEKVAAASLQGLVAAERHLEQARADEGVTLTDLRKKKNADYFALKPITLFGKQYEPGETIPRTVTDQLPHAKKSGWLTGSAPTLGRLN